MANPENYLGVEPDWDGLEITRSEGCLLFDRQRRRYIDFLSGWCVGNLGWSRPEIIEALRRYDGPFYVYPGYLHAPWLELAKMLIEIAPGRLKKCFRATGGSEAVDIALQAAMLQAAPLHSAATGVPS